MRSTSCYFAFRDAQSITCHGKLRNFVELNFDRHVLRLNADRNFETNHVFRIIIRRTASVGLTYWFIACSEGTLIHGHFLQCSEE